MANLPDHERDRWYMTTAIPYVNARPHLGFAFEMVLTDALARYHRLQGKDVWFLTGTDENSLKNVQAARREGISTHVLVDRNAAQFHALRDVLHLSFDDFIRTSVDPRHAPGVWKLWDACHRNGDIYKRSYRGLYCVGCEQFYTEEELDAGVCPEHRIAPEVVEEENYFFRLSRYTEQIQTRIESGQLAIVPATRKNEVLSFIRQGLHDFSISRSQTRARGWGIPVPGDPEHVIYVWFDALGNYITALGYADDDRRYQAYWRDNPHRLHVIGKGITRFHAIYWPAILLSAGVPLPTTIFVHGYITVGGQKISKSLGNMIDPVALVEHYGTDALRYYLLREMRAFEDGDFTVERFILAYNAHLADQLGNLLHRVVGMVMRYYDGVVPAPGVQEAEDARFIRAAENLPAQIDAAVGRFAIHEALTTIWDFIGVANTYVIDVRPWELARQRHADAGAEARLQTALYNLVEGLRLIAHHCTPFLPATAAAVANQLGLAGGTGAADATKTRWGHYPAGTTLQPAGVLFPKIDLPPSAPDVEE